MQDLVLKKFARVQKMKKYAAICSRSYKLMRTDADCELRTDRLVETIHEVMEEAIEIDCSEDIKAYQRNVAKCMGAVRWCDQVGLLQSG